MVVDLTAVPLSALSNESRNILSSRLNPKKVIPIVGPDQLPRNRYLSDIFSFVNYVHILLKNKTIFIN